MVSVLIAFSTSFCAVPALSRVEPATNSGPTTTSIATSASLPMAEPWLQAMAAVNAPRLRASSRAPITYGVRPEAEMPITASFSVTLMS